MPDSVNKKAKNNLSEKLLQDDCKLLTVPQENDEWLPLNNQNQRDRYWQKESDKDEGWEELIYEWLAEGKELKLTKNQRELNSKLLQSLRRLEDV
ncbi:MAG: hypothetical protein PV340_03725 [Wolbachia sp.]|nr:hypothetical protein [Wolbachia sp.]MDD9336747.1 hypothetical protein [Wolbachia sp.]